MTKPIPSILLVDDDPPFRTVLAGELERLGFHVETADNGAQALAHANESGPDVMLLDLRLPDMSGLDVLKAIRGRNSTADVIMLTGHGSIDTAIEAIRLGAFDYVAKPCPLGELELRITRALERQELRRRTMLLERALTPADLRDQLVGETP